MIKGKKYKSLERSIFIFLGFSIGVLLIWPKIIREDSRKCFIEIIKDGSDGKVEISTIFSISPSYLLRINNAKNKYKKILLIGDFCFR